MWSYIVDFKNGSFTRRIIKNHERSTKIATFIIRFRKKEDLVDVCIGIKIGN